MAIYKANANGITHKDLIIGGQKHKAVYAGDKLVWKKGGDDGAFRFTWSGQFAITVKGECTVNTGNGNIFTATHGEDLKVKRYDDKHIYTAVISGNIQDIRFAYITSSESYRCDVISVLSVLPKSVNEFMKTHGPVISYLFYGCKKLKSFPKDLFKNLTNMKSANYIFAFTNITEVPKELFAKNIKLTSFKGTFLETLITSIPSGLFSSNLEAEDFEECFNQCQYLTNIPNELFAGLEKAKNFTQTFSCKIFDNHEPEILAPSPNRIIPPDLFKGCVSAEIFSSCFAGNRGITNIPETLFDDCINAKYFNGCLWTGDESTTAPGRFASLVSAPKLWIKFPNAYGNGCYTGQRKLEWWNSIPTKWRE